MSQVRLLPGNASFLPVHNSPALFSNLHLQILIPRLDRNGIEWQRKNLIEFLTRLESSIVPGNILFLSEVRKLQVAIVLNQYWPDDHLPPGNSSIMRPT